MNVILSESFTSAVSLPLASIPSPSVSYLQLGPFRIHFYALCILAGIIVCLWLSARRWAQVGGTRERVYDVAMWAIPAGIIGARAYHVLITDPGSYFGPNVSDPWAFLKIWEGGIGIMGAVSVGALGAWIACRRYQINYAAFADAVAPGIILAQAFGRWATGLIRSFSVNLLPFRGVWRLVNRVGIFLLNIPQELSFIPRSFTNHYGTLWAHSF